MVTIKITRPFSANYFDKKAFLENKILYGIDEVGRGALVGPVVTSAVQLHTLKTPKILRDSKLLSTHELREAYEWIIQHSTYACATVSHYDIDRYGIYKATLSAMKRAVFQLSAATNLMPDTILVDAMPLTLPHITNSEHCMRSEQEALANPWGTILHFNYGETRSKAIAAASIVAKVTRDYLISEIGKSFPIYELERHKGYGTAIHQAALLEHGMSIMHRTSFTTPASKKSAPAAQPQLQLF